MLKMRCFVFEKFIKIFFYIYKYSYNFFLLFPKQLKYWKNEQKEKV